MLKFFIFLVFLFSSLYGFGQRQERSVFIYNVALGGLSSGIGAMINKPADADLKKIFIKGVWQGSIGGLINYTSKKTLYLINRNQNSWYGWPAKLLHSAGTSIIDNASLANPFLQNWAIDYGLLRFDFSLNNSKPLKVRLLPGAVFGIVLGMSYGKFDFKNSFKTGQLIFYNKDYFDLPLIPSFDGVSFLRSSLYIDNKDALNKHLIISHELVHQFQHSEYLVVNTWLKPLEKKIKPGKLTNIFSKYVYFDFPYFMIPYYISRNYKYVGFYRNFFEFEAQRFATNRYVRR